VPNWFAKLQVPVLNGTWLQRKKIPVPCGSVTGRFHCNTMINMPRISLTFSVMMIIMN
jgi:hypothetical protein